MSKLDDLTGKRYGRLVVTERADSLNGKTRWVCKCDCGKTRVVHAVSLKTGNTTSCGCFRTENARRLYSGVRQKDKSLYAVWNGIKQRCTNPNNKSYHNYGGRGITICEEWRDNYESFYYWAIGAGYVAGKQIDRIDNNKGYHAENCRWVDNEVQSNNKRRVILYTIDGEKKSLAQWCRVYKMDYYLVRQRVRKLGWDILSALTTEKYMKTARRIKDGTGKNL